MKLPEVLARHRSRVLRGLIVGAGRWLIGSFFAPFQKIDACQRHGHRIRDFSAPCPDPTRGRQSSSGGGVAAKVVASTTRGAEGGEVVRVRGGRRGLVTGGGGGESRGFNDEGRRGAVGDAARRVRPRLHQGGPRGLPRLELYRCRGGGTAGCPAPRGGANLPSFPGGA